ncbi:hypothetical protein N7V53_13850 [Kosakonia sp. HypNH10]|uniref:hypothetical protein n=1 Tax=Kosakonia TaxID=1330547 RepID=UPI0024492A2E|nr:MULTISPECIES: hypothetical protein [Kosakonia]MDH2913609.1 hypothetical protein [Kosakonia sp. HypNH10]WRY61305.1 hypothetical protein P8F81_10070 [Kosakonia cowanii]
MHLLSWIMLKLAWLIPLAGLIFAGYVAFLTHKSNKRDANIKENGVDIEAIITEVVPDKYQRANNKFVSVVTVKYIFSEQTITSKRGIRVYVTDKDKIKMGKSLRIRVNPARSADFYYLDHENC